jgi:Lar family restriction alleviation protein
MSKELKPCPFCGSNRIVEDTATDNTGVVPMTVWFVKCTACGAFKNSISNPDRAIKRWNTRPAKDALRAENERLKEKLARHRLANMKLRKFINEDLFYVLTRYLPKKQVFSEIIGFLRLKYDHIENITEKGGEDE